MSNTQVVLVDQDYHPIGQEEKIKAHQLGLCHLAFSVFVLRHSSGIELLMQKRAAYKYHSAGLWTNTCCSHPGLNQKIQQAATWRLKDEMGVEATLHYAGVFHYYATLSNGLIENEVDHVFYAWVENDCPVVIDPQEVECYAWISLGVLKKALLDTPWLYTPWLEKALSIVEKKIIKVA